jgi:hypothetical protein
MRLYTAPADTEPAILCDWVEASCIFGLTSGVSTSDVESAIEGASIATSDETIEETVASIWTEVSRRQRALGALYPFSAKGNRLRAAGPWDSYTAYSFCLALSCRSHFGLVKPSSGKRRDALDVLFEQVVEVALAAHLKGRSIRFGAPRIAPVPVPYDDALAYICRETGEPMGRVPAFHEFPQDEKLDVIGWIPMDDQREGKIIVLTQCTTSADWEAKANELRVRVWTRYIESPFDPQTALAFPFVAPPDTDRSRLWYDTSARGGLLMDRLRLVLCVGSGGGGNALSGSISDILRRARDRNPEMIAEFPVA